ncbi:MAG: YciI family protein [Archangiaceae bacterium]|nr:YciI family protein [Archangiaceae bacterium]
MKYLILIYGSETSEAQLSSNEQEHMMGDYLAYTQQLAREQVLRAGEQLKAISTATTVRVRNGKVAHTDGPFAETKEQLGGFYLVDMPSKDAALAWAEKCPGARFGSIELRPIAEMQAGGAR